MILKMTKMMLLLLVWILPLLLLFVPSYVHGNAIAGRATRRVRSNDERSLRRKQHCSCSIYQCNNNEYGPTVAAVWRQSSRPIINVTSSGSNGSNDQINDNFLNDEYDYSDDDDGDDDIDGEASHDNRKSNDKINYYHRSSQQRSSTPTGGTNSHIKLRPQLPQPRKNELWLPWPLGAMRNDFYRYAAEQQQQQRSSSNNNNNYKSSNAGEEWHQQLLRSKKWVTELIDKAGVSAASFQRFPIMTTQQQSSAYLSSQQQQQQKQQENNGCARITDGTSLSTTSRLKHTSWLVPPWGTKKMSLPKTTTITKDDDRSLLRGGESIKDSSTTTKGGGGLDKAILFQYLQLQDSVRLRQLGYVGSDFSIHLPPASPVLLFYFCLPSKVDPIRRLVKYVVAGATLSWMHSEGTKYRRFSPLPVLTGVNVRAPDLPPFLPEMETMWPMIDFGDDLLVDDEKSDNLMNNKKKKGDGKSYKKLQTNQSVFKKKNNNIVGDRYADDNNINNHNNNNNRHHHTWEPFQSFGSFSSIYRTWVEGQSVRNMRSAYQRRIQTSEQLLTLQKNTSSSTSSSSSSSSLLLNSTSAFTMNVDDAGYALVTGASSGIGRAISVELARYNIPLILVARDIIKLKTVANDIERHYNVKVKILQADLSTSDCAQRIYDATKGLNVDILVNNAGVCTHGDFVDGDSVDIMNMMSVNMGAVTQLSQLYGRDMKERRRGRILIVSSISGALPGNPNVAVYAATKAYEKSFASSLGREMERYGVGVTCLLPGAVKDTNFASRSDVEAAACFHIPGYAKTPEFVAGEGIKALMMGYPEIYPGAVNRMFVKAFMPMLPPRFSTMIGEMAWNPWQWGDVMPQRQMGQRRGRSIVSHAKHNDVYAEPDEIDTPLQSTLSTVPTTMETPWKFQLPDILKSNTKESDELVSRTEVNVNEQIQEFEPFKQDGKTSHVIKISAKESDDTKIDRTIGIVGGAVAMKNVTESEVDTTLSMRVPTIENESNTGTNTLEEWKSSLALPPASTKPPNDANLSAPLTLLDCIEQEKEHIPSSSSENCSSNGNADGTTESQLTWLGMDSKDYDFRDRRQSY